MAKTAKDYADAAFKFAENMIEKKQASIDAGTLEGEELEKAKAAVAEFKQLKQEYESSKNFCSIKKFAAEGTEVVADEKDLFLFVLLRKLILSIADDGINHDELYSAIMEQLSYMEVNSDVLTSTLNHVAKLKGLEYSEVDEKCYQDFDVMVEQHPEITEKVDSIDVTPENVLDILAQNDTHVIKFAGGDGLEAVKNGVKFLEEMNKRMKNAEHPNEPQINEVSKAIAALHTYTDAKSFSANESFLEGIEDKPEITEGDDYHVRRYHFVRGEKSVDVEVTFDESGNPIKFMDGEVEIPVENFGSYVLDSLEVKSGEVSVKVDPETGDIE